MTTPPQPPGRPQGFAIPQQPHPGLQQHPPVGQQPAAGPSQAHPYQGAQEAPPYTAPRQAFGTDPHAGVGNVMEKKPWWKKTWAIATAAGIVGLMLGVGAGGGDGAAQPGPTVTVTAEAEPGPTVTVTATETMEVTSDDGDLQVSEENAESQVPESVADDAETSMVDESALTMGQKNAVRQAESYLSFTSFSRTGLIGQLKFEGYDTADAEFAVGHIEVDWNEQAALKAEAYLEFTSFSRSGLIDQLEFEGFSAEQAEFGADAVGM